MQINPKFAGNAKIGECMTVTRQGLVGEDAVVFNQPLAYSIKTNERTTLLRSKSENVNRWPDDIKDRLKVHFLDKYQVFFSQSQIKQERLNLIENKQVLQMEVNMQDRVQKNYPNAIRPIQEIIKAKALKRINNFKPEFLRNKDERWAK